MFARVTTSEESPDTQLKVNIVLCGGRTQTLVIHGEVPPDYTVLDLLKQV